MSCRRRHVEGTVARAFRASSNGVTIPENDHEDHKSMSHPDGILGGFPKLHESIYCEWR